MERWPLNFNSASQNCRMVITPVAFSWFCHFPALRSGAYCPPPPTALPGAMLCARKWKGRDLKVDEPQLITLSLPNLWTRLEQFLFHWSQSDVPVTAALLPAVACPLAAFAWNNIHAASAAACVNCIFGEFNRVPVISLAPP